LKDLRSPALAARSMVMSMAFKSGCKTFGIIGGGYHPSETVFRYNGAAGLGFHQMMTENMSLNLEAVSTIYMTDLHFNDLDQTTWIHSLKLLLDYRIAKKFGIFAGPTMNLLQSHQSAAFEKTPSALWEKQDQADSHPFQKIWIGVQAGIYYKL